MDVHCCNCGEPWDQYHLRHDISGDSPEELADEGWSFGSSRLVVLSCPCRPPDGRTRQDAKNQATLVQELAQFLGDDEDGLASTLEDFGL